MSEVMWRRWGAVLLIGVVMAALAAALIPASARADGTDTISGEVLTAGGAAATGATVYVYSTTDPDTPVDVPAVQMTGTSYTVSNLADGTYYVQVVPAPGDTQDAPTYYSASGAGASDIYGAAGVTLNAGSPNGSVNVQMLAGGNVAGYVTSPSGTAVPDVNVYLCNAAGLSADLDEDPGDNADAACLPPITTAAGNGFYDTNGIPPGTYYEYLDPSTADTTTASNYTAQWYGAAGGSITATEEENGAPITVTAGQSTQNINTQLAIGGEITGQITDAASKAPLEGTVAAYDSTGVRYGYQGPPSSSNPTGPYTIYGLPAGIYYLEFNGYDDSSGNPVADAYGWYDSSGTPAVSWQTGTGVTVAGNNSSSNATIAMPVPGEITGRITANGNPIGGVEPVLFDSQDNVVAYNASDLTRSESDGTYEITGLTPGAYKVEFLPEGDANLAFQFFSNASSLSGATIVSVAASPTPTPGVSANLVGGGTITGTVTAAAGGGTVPDVTVQLQDANGDVLDSTTTLANGTYSLKGIPSGTYYVEFIPAALGLTVYQPQYYGGEQVLNGSTSVSVTSGQTTSNINASLEPSTQALEIPQIASSTPTISGTAKVGDVLSADVSGWSSGTTFAYQWYAAGKAITGATTDTLSLKAAQYLKAITVQVTGMQSGYLWANQTSAPTKAVAAGTLKTVLPKITGTLRLGHAVAVKTGSWTAGTKFTYQWYANGRKIVGARKATLTLGLKEYKKRLSVKVTGVLAGYKTVSRVSPLSAKVARALPVTRKRT